MATVYPSESFDPAAVRVTAVALSRDTTQAALNIKAQAFANRRPTVGVWELSRTSPQAPPPEAIDAFDSWDEPPPEAVLGNDDGRVLVPPTDFAPGGKYRCMRAIVKLISTYEFAKPDQWMMGTGWLVAPNLLVTAGHVAYDWAHNLGRATEVKAYIGYNGRQSTSSPNVQFRHVSKILAPVGWLSNKGVRNQDVSFMQLDSPFTGVTPFKFQDTQPTGDAVLGVVGYPGDKVNKSEKGAQMYQMFEKTRWNLGNNKDTMLEYQIDTYGGNSGSPVLVQGANSSIGAHVYGGTAGSPNSASVIGKFGHPYSDYVKAMSFELPSDGALHMVAISADAVSTPHMNGSAPISRSPRSILKPASNGTGKTVTMPTTAVRRRPSRNKLGAESAEGGEEFDFFGFVKTAAGVATSFLPGPVGVLANLAIGAASKLAESAGEESLDTLSHGDITEGPLQRAILAEAALVTLQGKLNDPNCTLTHDEQESIFSTISTLVRPALPILRQVAKKVVPAITDAALRVTMDSLDKSKGAEGFSDVTPSFAPPEAYSEAIDTPSDPRSELFLQHLLSSAGITAQESTGGESSEEAFLGDLLRAGLRAGKGGLITAARTGLPLIADAIKKAVSEESADFDEPNEVRTTALPPDVLASRAALSEATLQALMILPPERLQEEGFFDDIFKTVKKIAPVVLPLATNVVSAIHPQIGGFLRKVTGQESAYTGEGKYQQRRSGSSSGRPNNWTRPISGPHRPQQPVYRPEKPGSRYIQGGPTSRGTGGFFDAAAQFHANQQARG